MTQIIKFDFENTLLRGIGELKKKFSAKDFPFLKSYGKIRTLPSWRGG